MPTDNQPDHPSPPDHPYDQRTTDRKRNLGRPRPTPDTDDTTPTDG